MKRKLLAIILALILCIGLAVPVLAEEDEDEYDYDDYVEVINVTASIIPSVSLELPDEPGLTVTLTNAYDFYFLRGIHFHTYEFFVAEGGTVSFNQDVEVSQFMGEDDRVLDAGEEIRSPDIIVWHGSDAWSAFRTITDDDLEEWWISGEPLPLEGLTSGSPRPSLWAENLVSAAIAAGLVPRNLQFAYTQAITRAEFSALAVALYEVMAEEITGRLTFSDSDDVNVQKAAYIEVVEGVGDNRFDPDSSLTREQAAVMLARLAVALERPFPDSAPTFADNDSVSYWAVEGVGRTQAAGIMTGVGDNRFAPQGPYTREQSIVTIMRVFDSIR